MQCESAAMHKYTALLHPGPPHSTPHLQRGVERLAGVELEVAAEQGPQARALVHPAQGGSRRVGIRATAAMLCRIPCQGSPAMASTQPATPHAIPNTHRCSTISSRIAALSAARVLALQAASGGGWG